MRSEPPPDGAARGADAAAEAFVVEAVLADPLAAAVLEHAPSVLPPDWWLTGGAVFQNVWNRRTGRPAGFGVTDHDVFYHDASDLSWASEDGVVREVDRVLARAVGDRAARVQVRNQARVHLWYPERYGLHVEPLPSAAAAIDGFAAPACAVGIRVGEWGLEVYAPFGLDDTLALRLRPRPGFPLREVYESKCASYRRRWPELAIEAWPDVMGP